MAPMLRMRRSRKRGGLDMRPCWPRRSTWGTRATTGTRPGRCCSSSCWPRVIAAQGRRPSRTAGGGGPGLPRRQRPQRPQPGDGGLQGDGRRGARRRGQHRGDHHGPQRNRFRHPGQRPGRRLVHGSRRRPPTGSTSRLRPPNDANPDIGDSTITETAGIGGFAMAAAPAIVTFVSGTPRDAMDDDPRDVRDHDRRASPLHHSGPRLPAARPPASTSARSSSSASHRGSTPASPTAKPASARSARAWSGRRWRSSRRR